MKRLHDMARDRALGSQISEQEIAAELLPLATAAERDAIVVRVLADWAWRARRNRALTTERSATRPAAPEPLARRTLSDAERFAEILADPATLYGQRATRHLGRRAEREAFRHWCGDRFDEWYARAAPIAAAGPNAALFGGDWHPGGPRAHGFDQLAEDLRDITAKYAAELRMEWTAELLATEFALGDGRRVTWGSATLAEHEQRAAMLEQNAVANAEAAARHRSAIQALGLAGAPNLAELVAV